MKEKTTLETASAAAGARRDRLVCLLQFDEFPAFGPDDAMMSFDAFDLRIVYDKIERRIWINATITEHVPDLLGGVAQKAIAGRDSSPRPSEL